MVSQWWSWGLMAIGVLGLYFAGKAQKRGWMIGLFAQILWIVYAIVSHQWGFIVSAVVYGSMYARNYWLWRQPVRIITSKDELA